jgi:hypothetical protein
MIREEEEIEKHHHHHHEHAGENLEPPLLNSKRSA